MTSKAVTEGGLEYARSVLEKAFGNQTALALLEKVTKPGTEAVTAMATARITTRQTLGLLFSYSFSLI